MLILISGLPGSGKTTLARAFSARSGAVHLNSDLLRRELNLMGHYRPEDKQKVYATLLARASQALSEGKNVVVDSALHREESRAPFRGLAADRAVPLRWVQVRSDAAVIRERLRTPRADSEADFAVYDKIRREAEPLAEPHLDLRSDATPLAAMVESIVQYVAAPLPEPAVPMTRERIEDIVAHHRFPGCNQPVDWLETHISWLILTPEFVFKIKKPLKFSFLDFSTFEKRAHCCREEVRLNRRLVPDMYLGVLPVGLGDDGIAVIGDADAMPIDAAVWMKRMDETRQMDKLLRQDAVTATDLEKLATVLAQFHRSVAMKGDETCYSAGDNRTDFDDLFRLEPDLVQRFGATAALTLASWRRKVGLFLDKHEPRLHARASAGFWIDGHGDLHTRNVFLLPEGPVVFDCIDFNPHFRKGDVLSELAFLCMDLDASGHPQLAEIFLQAYRRRWPCIEGEDDEQLFRYFKAYRANVRLKVTVMELQQHSTESLVDRAGKYWGLLARYVDDIEI